MKKNRYHDFHLIQISAAFDFASGFFKTIIHFPIPNQCWYFPRSPVLGSGSVKRVTQWPRPGPRLAGESFSGSGAATSLSLPTLGFLNSWSESICLKLVLKLWLHGIWRDGGLFLGKLFSSKEVFIRVSLFLCLFVAKYLESIRP